MKETTMKRRFVLAVVALMLASPFAYAHGPSGAKVAGANGGDIVDVDGGHIELVISATELRIYITDLKDAALSTAGFTARAIIQDGAKQAVLPLAPRAPNLLVAPLSAPLSKDAKIAVSTTLAKDGKPVQARFVVK
jgi:hypothetical protein